jgi:hypothetical protein
MKRLITAVAAAMLLAGCQSDPTGMTTSLDGQWVRTAGSQLTFQLSDNGKTASGMGIYMIDATKSGTFLVSGIVDGNNVKLDLAFDNKTVAHFTGTRTHTDILDGTLTYDGSQPAIASFQKAQNMNMGDPMNMDNGMGDMMMKTARH